MTHKQITDNIELDLGLKLLTQSFTDVAAIKLQRIRRGIERNRNFISEVSGLFAAVKKLTKERSAVPDSKKKGGVAILVTSNYHFYGGLERRLMSFYLNTIKKLSIDSDLIGIDRLVIGQSGKEIFNYQSIVWKDDLPTEEDLKKLSNLVSDYQRILVFYPLFQSVLVQKPVVVDITEARNVEGQNQPKFEIDYILEPEIGRMWQFFENQILKLLLDQTFLEAELSRTAARLISMDQARENAEIAISKLKKALASAKRSIDNIHILETESAMFKIRKVVAEL